MYRDNASVFHSIGAAVILFLLCQKTEGHVVGIGSCPTVNPTFTYALDPFIPTATGTATGTALTNTWYEVRRYPTSHHTLSCVQYYFTTAQTTALWYNSVVITGTKSITGRKVRITGTVNQRSTGDIYRWTIDLNLQIPGLSHTPNNLIVLSVDPTNSAWLVLYSCKNYGIFNIQSSWILTSTRNPSDATIATALAAVQALNLPINNYITTDQTYC